MSEFKIKIIDSIDHSEEGKLPEDMIGNVYIVKESDKNGVWVEHFGEKTLVLREEYEVI
jgi:hypothetical protein